MPVPRLALVVAAWLLAVLAPVGPASAGGPTSVLLSVPGDGRTASLSYADADYTELATLVGAFDDRTEAESEESHEVGAPVTLTWLVHDVSPWRVDRIYLRGAGAPWIASQAVTGTAESVWDSPVVWHQPEDGEELTRLLDRLGVGPGEPTGEAAPGAATGDVVRGSAPPASAAPGAVGVPPGPSARDRVWWGLGGVAGGVLLAATWTRARSLRLRGAADAPPPPDPDGGPDRDPTTEWISVGR